MEHEDKAALHDETVSVHAGGSGPPFAVVGIGASAGGVSALQEFFEHMPPDTGLAFVVILHLSPEYESQLAAVLQTRTAMPVIQVTERVRVAPNTVYVIPPSQDLAMEDDLIRLFSPERVHGRHGAVDLFFRTLAASYGPRSFGVVLSGTGADGSVGIRHIKEAGGVILAQDPADAEYDGMPRHAITTGVVDLVLPVSEIPARLLAIWGNARRIVLPPDVDTPRTDTSTAAEDALRDVLATVRDHTGHDFAHYKRPTMLRRIERRMQVTAQPTLPSYRDYLRLTPAEARLLLADLLIGVTNFFRDPRSFEAMEREVIPALFAGKGPDDRLRVWVAGCSTGEEAYSVAMLLLEYAGQLAHPPTIQIFATDIDDEAIAKAQDGSYSEAIAVDVTPTRLQRFFTKEPGGYRVIKEVRERILFANHNLLNDPPFTHVELITCRNLLIYLQRDLQSRVFELFHFALRPSGILFLGTSESVDSAGELFTTVSNPHRLFRATATDRRIYGGLTVPVTALRQQYLPTPRVERQHIAFGELHQRMLERYAPPSLIINAEYEIVHLSEHAGRFLQLGGGAPSLNLLKVVLPELRLELRTALFQAFQTGRSTEARRVRIERDGRTQYVNMVARPERNPGTNELYALVLFDEVDEILGTEGTGAETGGAGPVVRGLEAEAQRLREQLQMTVEQYDTTVEELKLSNEELQAVNEELRAVNEELKYSIDEVSQTNDDLRNLIASTDIATIFLDRELRITLFTPRARDLFNLIPTDTGRPLSDIRSTLQYDILSTDATHVLERQQPVEREVQTTTGAWYLTRLVPYRTGNNRISGVVLTCVDVTTRKRHEATIQQSEERLRLILESVTDYAILTFDPAGVITSWNIGAERAFGYSEAEALGQPSALLFTPEDREQGAPAAELRQAVETGRAMDERWHLCKDGTRFYVNGSLTPLRSASGDLIGFVKIARDLTAERQAQQSLHEAYQAEQAARAEAEAALSMRDHFLSIASHELRTPMTSLLGYAHLLPQAVKEGKGDAVKMSELIARQSHRLNALIEQLLDVSRLQQGQFVVELQPVDLAQVAAHVVSEVRMTLPSATKHTIDLHHCNEPVMVVGDAQRLEEVLHNLLNNALKYSPRGGPIHVQLTRTASEAVLEVQDAGIGIAGEAQAHLFELFYRAPNVGVRASGFGVGLYIVHEIVRRHNGRIKVESAEGKGSTFRVLLPLAEPTE